jgi:hypothetical protein
VVTEETIDRTGRTIDILKSRPFKSRHLGSCPIELEQGITRKNLISLYCQRLIHRDEEPQVLRMKLVPVGVLCLRCKYHSIESQALNTTPAEEISYRRAA